MLREFAWRWSFRASSDGRKALDARLPPLLGTVGKPARESARAALAIDWLLRPYVASCLDAAGLALLADEVRAMPRLESTTVAKTTAVLRPVASHVSVLSDAALRKTYEGLSRVEVAQLQYATLRRPVRAPERIVDAVQDAVLASALALDDSGTQSNAFRTEMQRDGGAPRTARLGALLAVAVQIGTDCIELVPSGRPRAKLARALQESAFDCFDAMFA